MTKCEIQLKISCLENKIDLLYQKNDRLNNDIKELEECISGGVSLTERWAGILSDCYERVRNSSNRLNSSSGFREHYLNSINSILSGREATTIGDCFQNLKHDPERKIDEIIEEISNNNKIIDQYQSEIFELRSIYCD